MFFWWFEPCSFSPSISISTTVSQSFKVGLCAPAEDAGKKIVVVEDDLVLCSFNITFNDIATFFTMNNIRHVDKHGKKSDIGVHRAKEGSGASPTF